MAARGCDDPLSALSRAVQYFKEAELEDADYVLGRALSIVNQRKEAEGRPTQAKQPKVRRTRRTKAQLALAEAAAAAPSA